MDPITENTTPGAGEQAATASDTTQQQAASGAAATVDNTSATTTTTQTDSTAQQPAPVAPVAPVEPVEPVIPDGYVAQSEVETERTARVASEARARSLEIKLAAQNLGFADVSDAERFLNADATDIESALATVLESKPYLKKQADAPVIVPTSATNPARTNSQAPIFTQAQISDRAFWNANKAAIQLAMREGRIQG